MADASKPSTEEIAERAARALWPGEHSENLNRDLIVAALREHAAPIEQERAMWETIAGAADGAHVAAEERAQKAERAEDILSDDLEKITEALRKTEERLREVEGQRDDWYERLGRATERAMAAEERAQKAERALREIVTLLGQRYGGGGIHDEVKAIAAGALGTASAPKTQET